MSCLYCVSFLSRKNSYCFVVSFCFGENEHFHIDLANICTEEERKVHSVNGPIQNYLLKLKYSPNWSGLTVTKSHNQMNILSHDHDLYIYANARR